MTTWTLERIRMRCTVCSDEDGGCWLWQGGMMRDRYPILQESAPEIGRKQRQVYVRRKLFELVKRRRPPATPAKVVAVTCGANRCVAPAHLVVKTKSQVLHESLAVRIASRISAAKATRTRVARSKVPDADLGTIRGSDEPLAAIAGRYGISVSYAHALRSGQARRDRSNPFGGLMPARQARAIA